MKGLFEGLFGGIFTLVLIMALSVALSISGVSKARAVSLGGLDIVLDKSDTAPVDSEMLLEIKGHEAMAGGGCSKYAYSLKVNGASFGDLLAFCGLVSGDISGDNARARATIGVSPINISGIRTYVGIDPIRGGIAKGVGASISATHDYLGR